MEFFILTLACWRLTNLLVDDSEDGPWNVLHWVRYRLGVRYDQSNRPYGVGVLGKAFTCMWCASLWIATLITLVSLPVTFPIYRELVVFFPLALSAGALLLNKQIKR